MAKYTIDSILAVSFSYIFLCLGQIITDVSAKSDNGGLCCIRRQLFETVDIPHSSWFAVAIH